MGYPPNKAKGDFRPVYESMPDHPKFQCLQPPARLLLYVLKNTMGATGIQIVYPAVLSEQTGLPVDVVELAAQELERVGWIRREWKVWWLVGGLEHEPNLSMKNAKHRTYVLNQIRPLPRLQIVVDFLSHYGLDDPDPGGETIEPARPDPEGYDMGYRVGYQDAYKEPSPSPSPSPTQPPSSTTTSPVAEGSGLEQTRTLAGDVERRDEVWAEIHDAAYRGLGLCKLDPRQEDSNRDLLTRWRYRDGKDPYDVLAAIRGACLIRDDGTSWLVKGTAYGLAALVRSDAVVEVGDGATRRKLWGAAVDRWRKHDAGRGRQTRNGPTLVGQVLDGLFDSGADERAHD